MRWYAEDLGLSLRWHSHGGYSIGGARGPTFPKVASQVGPELRSEGNRSGY